MTSGNGNNAPSVIGSVPQNGKSIRIPPPVVKPPVLTHLIGGFVIQEGADPFPVEHPSFSIDALRRCRRQPVAQSPRISTKMEEFSSKELRGLQGGPMLTCELCGKVDSAHIFKGSKRFCSMLCAKRYNMSCTKRVGLYPPGRHTLENLNRSQRQNGEQKRLESKHKTEVGFERKPPPGAFPSPRRARRATQGSASERRSVDAFNGGPALPKSPPAAGSPPSPPPPAAEGVGGGRRRRLRPACLPAGPPARDPGTWGVENVYRFISSLPGCLEIGEEFRSQEIDGQALLLLKEDHLMGAMNIKLGPALKIYAQICLLKDC
ncbi:LOW QUALITY PROTEIN: polyhomeotic-like protein 2 [Gadus macrocephalus]|uniref:LOW QUALITY PROTEIN: polyhomeotic-like protein 2 n=1 Tax=Gadus macrocephalus TaxID=80720 RepID=UPI0028CBBD11|nr:LOW QUALITY PROTEIN: polyhomeotic-like protein 2 [Gadus macrocephalus]